MGQADSERQLLFALLAFQTNFIDRPKLLNAFDVWSQNKAQSVASLLVEQGAINDDERQLLEGLVARHVARFSNDVQKSLGHVSALNTSVRDELQRIASPDLQASLKIVGKDADPYATVAQSIGKSTSEGTRFRILRPHARGGLGEVFVAADGELPREVALKQIQARHADDADSRARFLQEAEITGGLEHPNIVPVYGLGTYADGRPFYAMRFIRGDSLQDAVRRYHESSNIVASERTIQFRKLLQRFIDVCNAIDYAHNRGVLHRDLKPGNIMLGKYGETLVVDWGLAKAVGRKSDETIVPEERTLKPSGGSGSVETTYGAAIGTPAYMSPEQATGRLDELGPQSDVYSLGATLYELLTGQPPFAGTDLGAMLRAVQQGNFPSPRTISREVPKPLEAICLKAMSFKAGDRYATARALADELEHWLADEPTTAHRETFQERAARWSRTHRTTVTAGMALTATAVVALVVGLVAVGAEQRETEKQRQSAERQRIAAEAAKAEEAAQRKLADEQKQLADLRKTDADRQRDAAIATSARSNYFLADARWKEGRVAEARELLEAVSPEHRNFEWYLACREYDGSDITFYGHDAGVLCVAFSSDGTRLVSASEDNSIKLWDAITGAELRILAGHSRPVTSVAFSHDGARLASGSEDNTIKIWDAHTGEKLRTLTGHANSISNVVFSHNSKQIASSSEDKTIKLWNVQTGDEIRTFTGHTDATNSVAFSPDSARLASASADATIKLWDAETGAELRTISGPTPVFDVAFSPDGARLASANGGGTIKLWDAQTSEELRTLDGHASDVLKLTFSPDGARLASASWDGTIILWDAQTGAELRALVGHIDIVNSVAFNPDGTRIASASRDKTIKLWDARTGIGLRVFAGHTRAVNSVGISPDGKRLASASDNKTIKLWDSQTGAELFTFTGHGDNVNCVAFSPDGTRLVSASKDKTIKLWNVQSGAELQTLVGHVAETSCVVFSPDGKILASASWDKTIKLWDTRTGKELRTLTGHNNIVNSVAFSPDGTHLVSASWDKTIKLWDVQTGAELPRRIQSSDITARVAFSFDGSQLALGSTEGTIKLYDTRTGTELHMLTGHTNFVSSVVFSHDGARLASGSSDKTIKLWDVHTGAELRTITGHTDCVTCVAFSPDGMRLVSASWDHTIKQWDARPTEFRSLSGHASYVVEAAFSSDNQRLYSEDLTGNRLVWSVKSGERAGTHDFDMQTNRTADGRWLIPFKQSGERVASHGFDILSKRSADGRWFAVPWGKQVLLVDLEFKNTPDEKAYREFKVRLDPWWHAEQARAADLNTPTGPVEVVVPDVAQMAQQTLGNKPKPDWYSAAFHWAWVMKAYLDKPDKADQYQYHVARNSFQSCVAKWHVEFAAKLQEAEAYATKTAAPDKKLTPVSTNPDVYLPPIVREMLKK